jgi:hypothetical protein
LKPDINRNVYKLSLYFTGNTLSLHTNGERATSVLRNGLPLHSVPAGCRVAECYFASTLFARVSNPRET